MRPSQLLAAVVALSSVSAASSDVFDHAPALANAENIIYRRQDNSESADPETTDAPKTSDAPAETDATTTEKPTATNSDDSKTTDNESGSGTSKGTDSKGPTKTSGRPKPTNFGDDVPAGGIAMVTPSVFDGQQFYKIGDWVHLAWNYTSLRAPPSAVDIVATCTENQATYTLALNQSVPRAAGDATATGEVFWNTGSYKKDHPDGAEFLNAIYTLMIYDSNSSATEPAKPGYLAPFKQFTFGMYQKQPYTDYADGFKCANCSGALSAFEALTLKALFITSITTIASLLYFTASFGVW